MQLHRLDEKGKIDKIVCMKRRSKNGGKVKERERREITKADYSGVIPPSASLSFLLSSSVERILMAIYKNPPSASSLFSFLFSLQTLVQKAHASFHIIQ